MTSSLLDPFGRVSGGAGHRRLTSVWADHSIPDRLAEQIAARGDHVSVKVKDRQLTYHALDRQAGRIAHAILERRPVVEEAVCLLLEHDASVPAAIIGTLRAGKFSVTLDASYPRERNEFILGDSGARTILTNHQNLALAESLAGPEVAVVNIDLQDADDAAEIPAIDIGPDNLAYLSYTSGSTGMPKGVAQTHRGLLHRVLRQVNGWRLGPEDRTALFFAYNFGPSLINVFATLLSGATLVPLDVKRASPARVLSWLAEEEITFFHTVPTFFRHLTSAMDGTERLPRLRLIRLAGETIYGSDVRLFQQFFGAECVLQVGMGSTETGTILQSYFDSTDECPEGIVPPGYPTEDVEILLLDDDGKACEAGAVGEIAVRSRYLFSGYWRRPDLTAPVLLQDPQDHDSRIYVMGDLGRRLADGRFMHLGRKDAQVKIRGHRVELGEVEAALRGVPGVSAAAVTVTQDQGEGARLIAYVVNSPGQAVADEVLRGSLRDRLPDYMIPSAFVEIDELPLTPGGKVDRPALASRPIERTGKPSTAPRDHLEKQLVTIWETVLKTTGFGVHEDFYELGGDSLLAAQMVAELQQVTGQEVDLANLTAAVTIETLANSIEAGEQENLQTPILEIQAGGAKAPIFFCHGDFLGAGVFCRGLARHLGPDQPFYAIPPHGFGRGLFPQTIEAMADDRAETLLEFCPNGPLVLGGYCWGGLLALEIARRLRPRGVTVAALVVVDSDPRTVEWRPMRRFFRRVGAVLRLRETTEIDWYERSRDFVMTLQDKTGVWAKIMFLAGKLDRTRRDESSTESSARPDPVRQALPEDRRSRWDVYHRINQLFIPEPYTGPVALFGSSRLRERYPSDRAESWRDVAGQVTAIDIEGDHWTCVTTDVEDLARKMRDHLATVAMGAEGRDPLRDT